MLPALDASRRLVFPADGVKGELYSCPSCNERMMFRSGSVNAKHFAHYANSECKYNGGGGESEIHLAAKLLLAERLSQGDAFPFERICCSCRSVNKHEVKLEDNESAEVEYPLTFEGSKIIPDIAIINEKGITKIIEICHTHAQQNRPEPWYEFQASKLLENLRDGVTPIRDLRSILCKECAGKEKSQSVQCNGACFRQISCDPGEEMYRNDVKEKGSTCDCKLVQCRDCGFSFPRVLLDCKGGICVSCDMIQWGFGDISGRKRKKPLVSEAVESSVIPVTCKPIATQTSTFKRTATRKRIGYCGKCSHGGKELVTYRNCVHYSCLPCYNRTRGERCKFCHKSK